MKFLDRSLFLVMACLASALAMSACRSEGDDDDDATGDGDADSDSDSDSDADADADADGDADGDADECVGENTNETCSDFDDNNDNQYIDCEDFCCSRFTPEVTVCDATEATPIEDIRQGVVDPGNVIVEGMIVTGIDADGVSWYMQSADADSPDYTGIFVFVYRDNPNEITIPALGDIIDVQGDYDEFFDFSEISQPEDPVVVSSGNPVPEPVSVTPDEVGDEDGSAGDRAEPLESVLVQVMGYVTNLDPAPGEEDDPPTNEFAIGDSADGPDLLRINDHSFLLDPMPAMGDHVVITGNLRFHHGHFKIEPRSQDDLEAM